MGKIKKLDYGSLEGNSYGYLTVEAVHSITKDGVFYYCRCSKCGNYIIMSHHYLKSRRTTAERLDCGCDKRGHIKHPEYLVGNVFGRLTIIDYTYKKDHEYYYYADCNCGTKHIIVSRRDLLINRKQSCGCLQDEIYGSNVIYDPEKMKAIPGVSNPNISEYYKAKYKERMDPNRSEYGLYIKKDGTIVDENGCTFPIRFRSKKVINPISFRGNN